MKKLFPVLLTAFRLFRQTRKLVAYASITLLWLSGCMATQNRWQATQMRQQVMDYYNDQIMENLIRTKEKLPFVHVDITNLTAQDIASLSGTFGGGETSSFSRTSPSSSSSVAAALHTITRGVMRPFSYSVTPMRNTTLSIQAAPVLGKIGDSSSTPTPTPTCTPTPCPPTPTPTPTPTPPFETSKITTVQGPGGTTTTTEQTPKAKPTSTPKALTVYDLYDEFLKHNSDALQSHGSTPPKTGYVPGTIKHWETRWENEYYYIRDDAKGKNKEAYRDLCRSLFTKGQAQSIETTIQRKAQEAALVAPRPP